MIGQRLKELRKEKEISQAELGKILNITTSMVGLYEIDARNPSFEVLVKMSNYFCVSTDYILGLTNDKGASVRIPQGYAVVISEALEKDISPDKLKKIIEFSKQLEGL